MHDNYNHKDGKESKIFDYPKFTVYSLIKEQVNLHPDKVAIIFEDQKLSYSEMNLRVNQLAKYLLDNGVCSGNLVGIYMDRSINMILSILAVIKLGCIYIPLDSSFPAQRINYIIQNSGLSIILSHESLYLQYSSFNSKVICVDLNEKELANIKANEIQCDVDINQCMVIIYTSGSTGNPKGVQVSHASVVNLLASMSKEPGITESDRLLFITTICFDISMLELFLPLVNGATVIMASRLDAMDGLKLSILIEKQNITIMQATPTTWDMLINAEWVGKKDLKILCGGEALSRELANQLLERGSAVWNLYGPTETTIWSMIHKVEASAGVVPIGKPIHNTQIYILDESLNEVENGEVGELYIGGSGLSLGYINNSKLTDERFIPNPFVGEPSAFIYKTGDLVCNGFGGNVEYIGRVDYQVKIRGHRIELGEIERALETHPLIHRSIAVVVGKIDKSIVAYYITTKAGTQLSNDELRDTLHEILPDYMIPSFFSQVHEFPLTLNGKVDRNRLMAMDVHRKEFAIGYTAPATQMEKELVELWEDMLSVDKIGVYDNFLEVGGHSLLANRMLLRINQKYSIKLSLVDILVNGLTVSDWAKTIEDKLLESLSDSEIEEMLKELEELSEDEIQSLLLDK